MIRIIPRLDIKGPNVVKGLCFDGYRVLGRPEVFSDIYYNQGADELFFQDTVASLYNRSNLLEIVSRTAEKVMLPITVSGGIRSVNDIKVILRSGADKVAINTAATKNPSLLEEAAKMFGSQCIVVSIEAKRKENGKYEAYADYGAYGVIVLLFVGMIQFLKSTLMGKLLEIEHMVIKLIDRWNRSDESRDRRHEDILKELNDISDDQNFMKGRINSK